MGGGIKWDSGVDTPGYISTSTITFKTTGEIKAGFHFAIQLPDDGWVIPATSTPHIVQPANAAGGEYVFATGAYDSSTRTLKVTTSAGDIPEYTDVTITICHIKTPPKVTAGGTGARIRSLDNVNADAGLTDDYVAMTTDAITAGTLLAYTGASRLRFGTSSTHVPTVFTPGVAYAPVVRF